MAEAQKRTIDEQFVDEYSKKGLQPSTSSDGRVSKVMVQKQLAQNDPRYEDDDTKSNRPNIRQRPKITSTPTKTAKQNILAKKITQKTTVSGLNSGINSVVLYTWGVFQLPFAALNIVFFGLTYVWIEATTKAYVVKETAISTTGMTTPFGSEIARLLFDAGEKAAVKLNDLVTALTGYNLGAFLQSVNPQNVLIVTGGMIVAYLLILLLTISLVYMFAGIKPLSLFGRGAGLKITAVLLCFVGYATPILNLLPWIFVWTTAVWRYPK